MQKKQKDLKLNKKKIGKFYICDSLDNKNEEEDLSIVAEDAMQQLLFEVENVPFPTPCAPRMMGDHLIRSNGLWTQQANHLVNMARSFDQSGEAAPEL